MSERYLEGRVAMVTGGASGMGRAISLALADAGTDVIIGSLMDNNPAGVTNGEVVHRPGADELQRVSEEISAQVSRHTHATWMSVQPIPVRRSTTRPKRFSVVWISWPTRLASRPNSLCAAIPSDSGSR